MLRIRLSQRARRRAPVALAAIVLAIAVPAVTLPRSRPEPTPPTAADPLPVSHLEPMEATPSKAAHLPLPTKPIRPEVKDATPPDRGTEATSESKDEPATPPAPGTEVVSARTETTKVFTTEDPKQLRAEVYNGPIHYRDPASGHWREIDTTLSAQDGGRMKTRATDHEIEVAEKASDPGLGRVVVDEGISAAFRLVGAQPSTGARKDGGAIYENVFDGVDLKLLPTTSGLKELLVLHSPKVPDSYLFALELEGLEPTLEEGSVVFRDEEGKDRLRTPPGWMEDSDYDHRRGEGTISHGVVYELVTHQRKPALRISLDRAFLDSATYPVTVDPSFLGHEADTWIQKAFPNNNYSAQLELRAGTYNGGSDITRSLTIFLLPGLDGATINSASLRLYTYHSWSCQPRYTGIWRISTPWQPWNGWAQQPGYGEKVAEASYAAGYSSSCPAAWAGFNVKQTVQNWVNGTWPNYGLMVRAHSETDNYGWKKFISANHYDANNICGTDGHIRCRPHIVINYTPPNNPPNTPTINSPPQNQLVSAPPPLKATYSDPDGNAGKIRFRVHDSGNVLRASWDSPTVASGTQVTFTPQVADGTYDWYVQATDGQLDSGWATRKFRLDSKPPTMPTGLSSNTHLLAVPSVSNMVGMTWSPSSDPSPSYGLAGYATALNQSPTTPAGTTVTTTTPATSYSSQPNGTYFFHVRAIDNAGNVSPNATFGPIIINSGAQMLGLEDWWPYQSLETGPQASAHLNAAGGNLVVQHVDSTPVQGHGRTGFVLRRTYNSQEAATIDLPGVVGQGWRLDVAEAGDLQAAGISATGIDVSTNPLLNPGAVRMIDRDGTPHVFSPKAIAISIPHLDLLENKLLRDSLTPKTIDGTDLCITQTYSSPPGVHLGLWRYVKLGSGGSCGGSLGSGAKVAGFVAVRPDRVRYEFSGTGKLLSVTDPAGNELRYRFALQTGPVYLPGQNLGQLEWVYEPSTCATQDDPETCRGFHFTYPGSGLSVTDPAGRVTEYVITSGRLTKVINPDDSEVTYTYGGCSGDPNHLCSMTDPRGNATAFTYQASGTATTRRLASWTDRAGTRTDFTYNPQAGTATADTEGRRTAWVGIDLAGRATEIREGTTANNYSRVTFYAWDTPGCRLPTAGTDHNLCQVRTRVDPAQDQPTKDVLTSFVYNPESRLLKEHRENGAEDAISTYGYRTQYVRPHPTAPAVVATDSVSGSGNLSVATTRDEAITLYAISDLAQELTPRGNAAGGSFGPYLTTYTVDANQNVASGSGPQGDCGQSNTGLVCQVQSPAHQGSGAAVTRYTYDGFGQKTTMTTPKATAEDSSKTYGYTYYGDSENDLSGNTIAGGWLKAITDPDGAFVAFAYDAAGNVVRTWDRNATDATTLSSYPGTISSPAAPGFSQELYATGAAASAIASPWRYLRSAADQLGNTTEITADANGNPTRIRPPRGVAAGNTDFDTTQVFDARGAVLETSTPATTTTRAYTPRGMLASEQTTDGGTTVHLYDAVDRVEETRWARGPAELATSNCTTDKAMAPIPSGRVTCSAATTYDGADRIAQSSDGEGQLTNYTHDRLGRQTEVSVARFDGVREFTTTKLRYDRDGNPLTVCTPRQSEMGGGACAAGGAFSIDMAYDPAGTLASRTTHRQAGSDQTQSFTYDAEGNPAAATDANGHTTTYSFDFQGRNVETTRPRAQGEAHTTTFSHDPSGNVVTITRPEGLRTAHSYDAAHRPLDVVEGSDSPDASAAGLPTSDGSANIRTRTAYDADSNVVARFAPRAFTSSVSSPDPRFATRTDYDSAGRPVAQWSPRFDASTAADPTSGASPDQAAQCPTGASGYPSGVGVCVVRLSYDDAGRVDEVTLPTAGGSTNRVEGYTYTDDGLVWMVNSPLPVTDADRVISSLRTYDGEGRLKVETNALGHQTVSDYFADGLTKQVNDRGQVTTFAYDANANPVKSTDALGQTSDQTFYSDDLLEEILEPTEYTTPAHTSTRRDVTSYTYDAVGNVSEVLSPSASATAANNTAGAPVLYTYTHDDLLRSVLEPLSPDGSERRLTTYAYDTAGRKTSQQTDLTNGDGTQVTQPGGTQSFTYSPAGRLMAQTGREGETISTSYDPDGNPRIITDSTAEGSTLTSSFYLDSLPRTVSDGVRSTLHAYDGAGEPVATRERVDSTGTTLATTTHTYSDAGLPSQTETSRTSGEWTFSYDASGRPSELTAPNGLDSTYGWNTNDTLASVRLGPGESPVAEFSYSYDALRRIASQAHTGQGEEGSSPHSATFSYSYYADGRLETFNQAGQVTGAEWDPDGNRTKWGDQSFTYRADASIASAMPKAGEGLVPYEHFPFGGTKEDEEGTEFSYDGFDRTQTVKRPGQEVATYSYDGLDRRRQAHQPGASPEQVFLHHAGLGPTLLGERVATGTDTGYTHGGGMPLAAHQGSVAELLSSDGQGNVSTVTDGSGDVACTLRYDPFGTTLPEDPSESCNTGSTFSNLLYRSGRLDPSSGTYQWGSRTYDPAKAAFLTPDSYRAGSAAQNLSVGVDPLTMNRYAYVNGDPINLWDPHGHRGCGFNPMSWGGCISQGARKTSEFVLGSPDPRDFVGGWVEYNKDQGAQAVDRYIEETGEIPSGLDLFNISGANPASRIARRGVDQYFESGGGFGGAFDAFNVALNPLYGSVEAGGSEYFESGGGPMGALHGFNAAFNPGLGFLNNCIGGAGGRSALGCAMSVAELGIIALTAQQAGNVGLRAWQTRSAPRAIGPTGNPGAFAFEGVTGLTSKGGARSALGGLDATSAQLSAANRAIGRATSSSAINVGMYGERVVVQITRPGANGYQLIETVVARDGSRTVVQMAYDSAGRLVHYHPKFP